MENSVTTMISQDQLGPLNDAKAIRDARAIYKIYKALHPLTESGKPGKGVTKILRLAIVDLWQEPRMPRGAKVTHAHNKPFAYPWSPHARELYFANKADSSVTLRNKLILEHVVPLNVLVKRLLEEVAKPECTESSFLKVLQEKHKPLSFAIISREEDRMVAGKGFKNTIVEGEGQSQWARYEQGCGLFEKDFMALNADPRWNSSKDQ